jgi:hypothetical protein
MSDFDHAAFHRLLADLALQPLDCPESRMVRTLMTGDFETRDQFNGATVGRLMDLGLARVGQCGIHASRLLRCIAERGFADQILSPEFL